MRFRIYQIGLRNESEDRQRGCGHRGHHHGHDHESHHGWRRPDDLEGRGRGFGRGGGRARRGEARYIVLDVLKDGPMHGYEIIKTLDEKTGGVWAPSPGTVYPTLQYLEELGLIEATQDGERKQFALTDKGREELAARAEELEHFWGRFAGSSEFNNTEVSYIRDELETLMKTLWRGLHQPGKTVDQETLRKIRTAIETARDEIRNLLSEQA